MTRTTYVRPIAAAAIALIARNAASQGVPVTPLAIMGPSTTWGAAPDDTASASPKPTLPIVWPAADSTRRLARAAMPFVTSAATLAAAGTLLDADEASRVEPSPVGRRFQLEDVVLVTAPRGYVEGTRRLLLVRPGPTLRGEPVLVPTALLAVDGAAADLLSARIVRLFDAAEVGQRVLTEPAGAPPPLESRAAPLDTRVVWVRGNAELPTVGSVVLLDAGTAHGVREDDVFELLGPARRVAGRDVPGVRVGVVKVLRLSTNGAAAVVLSQAQPGIETGMHARRLPRVK